MFMNAWFITRMHYCWETLKCNLKDSLMYSVNYLLWKVCNLFLTQFSYWQICLILKSNTILSKPDAHYFKFNNRKILYGYFGILILMLIMLEILEIVILCKDATRKRNKCIKICCNLGLFTTRLSFVLSTRQKSINAQFISCVM